MIHARTRMYGLRMVVLIAEPTHPALAALPPTSSHEHGAFRAGSEAITRFVCDLSRNAVARLLGGANEAFGTLAG